MKIAIVANKAKCSEENYSRLIKRLTGMDRGYTICAESFAPNRIARDFCEALKVDTPDVVIVLGGDGTIIHTAQVLGQNQVPIIGINMGKFGYLAHFGLDHFDALLEKCGLERLLSKALPCEDQPLDALDDAYYHISERMLLEVRTLPCRTEMAVNDCVIDIGPPFRTTEFSVKINGHLLSTICGDGIIISTPTGSTAYNLSAGGPIVQPELMGITLTPKNPHRLSFRPIVVRADSVIEIEVPSPEGVFAIIDGQQYFELDAAPSKIRICRHSANLQLVQRKSYWDTLIEKLNWGG